MGTGFKGGSETHRSISENIAPLKVKYGFDNGYFGVPGNSSWDSTRNIKCDDSPQAESKEFYDKLAYGAIEKELPNHKGYLANMSDGTIITYRETQSSDGSPVVDINIKYSNNTGGIKQQKIHFVRRNNDDKTK